MKHHTTLRLIPALLAAAFSGSALASGFQLLEQNASGLGVAYAGSAAVAENASTVYFNPAAMTQLRGRHVSLGGTLIQTSYKFTNNGSSTGGLTGDGNDGGGLGFVPNAYLTWELTPEWFVGLGIGAPFGLKTEYDNPWVGAAQSVMFDIKTININPSVAWKANEMISVGFGVNWQKLEAEYVRAVSVPTFYNGATARLNLDGDAWGWNAGVLLNLSQDTKLGISYRSKIKHEVDGDVAVTSNGNATTNVIVSGLNAAGATSGAKTSITLPDTLIISGTHRLNDRVELLGDISWTGWSSIPKVDIFRTSGAMNGQIAQVLDTEFRDTWRVAIGTTYQLDDAWKLKFGLAYDQTPVKSAETRLVSLPDNDRTWFSVGAAWKLDKTTTVDFGAAYLMVKDSQINNNQSSATAATNRGTVTGDYSASAWLLGAQFSKSF